jgi:hypothetical protein
MSQTVDDLPEGQTRPSPTAPGSILIPMSEPAEANAGAEAGADDFKYSLHPDDPANFLKLCTALRILIKHSLSDEDLNHADRLIREYNTELIHVCHLIRLRSASCLLISPSSSMVLPSSSPIIIFQLTSAHVHATLVPFMTSGHFCSNDSTRY